LAPLNK